VHETLFFYQFSKFIGNKKAVSLRNKDLNFIKRNGKINSEINIRAFQRLEALKTKLYISLNNQKLYDFNFTLLN